MWENLNFDVGGKGRRRVLARLGAFLSSRVELHSKVLKAGKCLTMSNDSSIPCSHVVSFSMHMCMCGIA